jgi:hypothetical protein
MPRPAHHAPEHQALVVNLPGGAANRLLHADRGRFQGAILGLMWLELLSVHTGTAAIDAIAASLAGMISIASVSSTSGTAAGNLHDFGFDVPSVASCERLSAPSQDHMHRAFFKCTSFPSRLTTSPKKTPAEYVRTMQTLPIKSIRPPVETHKSTQ